MGLAPHERDAIRARALVCVTAAQCGHSQDPLTDKLDRREIDDLVRHIADALVEERCRWNTPVEAK